MPRSRVVPFRSAGLRASRHVQREAVDRLVVLEPWQGEAFRKALSNLTGANEDQSIGIKLLSRAIEEPLRQIVTNAGEDAAVVLAKVKDGKGTFGYNASTGAYGGMPDMGGMGGMGM